MSYKNNSFKDLPIGFAIELSRDLNAADRFAHMSYEQQQSVIKRAGQITDKDEMRSYVEEVKHFF